MVCILGLMTVLNEALVAPYRSNHLAEDGIAYVSYNTYPGWHTMEEVRQLDDVQLTVIKTQFNHKEKVLHGKTIGSIVGSQILKI